MVIAYSTKSGALLLGLSAANIERLQAGDPIRASRESHGVAVPAGLTVFIVAGDTEEAIFADMRRRGVIGEHTIVNQQRPL